MTRIIMSLLLSAMMYSTASNAGSETGKVVLADIVAENQNIEPGTSLTIQIRCNPNKYCPTVADLSKSFGKKSGKTNKNNGTTPIKITSDTSDCADGSVCLSTVVSGNAGNAAKNNKTDSPVILDCIVTPDDCPVPELTTPITIKCKPGKKNCPITTPYNFEPKIGGQSKRGNTHLTLIDENCGVEKVCLSPVVSPKSRGKSSIGDSDIDALNNDGQYPRFVSMVQDINKNIHITWVDSGPYQHDFEATSGLFYKANTVFYKMISETGDVLIAPTRVVDNTDAAGRPDIILDDQQRVHIVWAAWPCGVDWCWGKSHVDHLMIDPGLHLKDGSTLNIESHMPVLPHVISEDNDYAAYWARATLGKDGNIHIVWRDTFYLDLDLSNLSDTKIQYLEINSDTGLPENPEVTIASENTHGYFAYSWLRSTPSIASDSTGNLHVVWSSADLEPSNGDYIGQVSYMMLDGLDGSILINETVIDSQPLAQFSPANIIVDELDNIHIAISVTRIENWDWILTPMYYQLNLDTVQAKGKAVNPSDILVQGPVNVSNGLRNGGSYTAPTIQADSLSNLHIIWLNNQWAYESAVNYQKIDGVTGILNYTSPVVVGHSSGRDQDGDVTWNVGTSFVLNNDANSASAAWSHAWIGALDFFSVDVGNATLKFESVDNAVDFANSNVVLSTSGGEINTNTDANGQLQLQGLPLAAGVQQNVGIKIIGENASWVGLESLDFVNSSNISLNKVILSELKKSTTTIVAGVGSSGYEMIDENGVVGIYTPLYSPEGMASAPDGSLFVVDTKNNRVLKLSVDGVATIVAGQSGIAGYSGDGGLAINAKLNHPSGIGRDASGNLYIADYYNHVIRKVDIDGYISTIAGTGVQGFSQAMGLATEIQLDLPQSVAIAPNGTIIIADVGSHSIKAIRTDGYMETIAGNGAYGLGLDGMFAGNAMLGAPRNVVIGPDATIYFADSLNNRIRRINEFGILSTVVGTGEFGFSGDNNAADKSTLREPRSFAFDADGSIYVADSWNHRIRRVMPDGYIDTIVGTGDNLSSSGDNIPGLSTPISLPSGLLVSPDNSVYMSEEGGHQVRRIDSM